MSPPLRLIAPRSASRALRALQPTSSRPSPFTHHHAAPQRPFHASPCPANAHNKFNETVPDQPPPTDFARMDVLGQTPPPATSIDACLPDGFVLADGTVTISDGSGALLVAGEAFAWRPWDMTSKKLVNSKGQWDLGPEVLEQAFGVLGLVWPRPDLLILGLGPEMRPLSPAVRKHISSLGIRVEVADTRNAASQFNLLATERGVDQVAAALIPVGWREGKGA
ncbi:hypothetical protein CONLIGDRAFT_711806 [Coniochaeta ligniaria NRRL 30616]|uniref:NADH dehydrogenase [ubiquinone] 1 alpha subcomplex assembly factor 3 n=1 Tax=Coniochaeta ligniaria NRRL 30616 TaxID=1408157 RepID=A0A1J7JKT6_9PEZI|nr:hypothetical protein CONLIGDRAFT_711806 [Coniochaeta ligniaria NRRL 30616]